MTSAALELIGEAGLGYSFDSFTGQRNRYKLAMRDVEYVWPLGYSTLVLRVVSW